MDSDFDKNYLGFDYDEEFDDYEVFDKNEAVISLLDELKSKDENFGVSEENFCTFDAECMEFGVTYETFLEKFAEMAQGEFKFTEIQVDEFDEEESWDGFEISEDGEVDMDSLFDLASEMQEVGVDFKINGNLTSISVEFGYDWFNDQFVYQLNENLKELGYKKYFYFSNNGEECNVIYGKIDDINKINQVIKTDRRFKEYNIFSDKEI